MWDSTHHHLRVHEIMENQGKVEITLPAPEQFVAMSFSQPLTYDSMWRGMLCHQGNMLPLNHIWK